MTVAKAWAFPLAAFLLGGAFAFPAAAQDGDAAAGQRVFNQCRACHTLEPGKHMLGPSLHGIVGKKAGTVEGFRNYSPALQKSDVVWTEENIAKYMMDPKGFIPGNRMVFVGLKRPEDIQNVIAFIKQQSAK